MTVFNFVVPQVFDGQGGIVKVARNATVTATDPSTGATAAGLTQGGVSVSTLTSDAAGRCSFTATIPAVVIAAAGGLPYTVFSPDAIAAAIGAGVSSDAAVAALITSSSSTRTATDARYQNRSLPPLMMLDYCVGDGTTNDTTGAQAAIAAAISQGRSLYSPPGKTYLVDALTVTGTLRLEGQFTFWARTTGQSYVFSITASVDWTRASVWIDGKSKALYGIRGANFGRSSFGYLDIQHCTIWGKQFDPSGNNNVVTVAKFVARSNGVKSTQTLTETAETANVLTSSAGYGSFTIPSALTAAQVASNVTYWVVTGGLAYKVKAITTTTMDVFNLKASAGVGGTITVDIIIGGGLNIPAYGDSGVGAWGSMDVSANSNGVHIASLYGHVFNNLVLQANNIGISCSDYTTEMVLNKPYFESNDVSYVSWSYMAGVMFAPILPLEQMQNCINRLAANGSYDPKMVVIKDNISGLASPLVPGSNPGSRTLTPGQCYAYHRTAAGTWNFVIDNGPAYAALGAYFIMVDLSHASANIVCPVSLTTGTNNGDTIEGTNANIAAGGAAYTGRQATGKAVLKIYRVGTDWKVTVAQGQVTATVVTGAPTYIGQLATVGAVGYIATGTSASTDWKQIT